MDLDHVTKRFAEDATAVDDVSLHIEHGEFFVLLGPSGCGKSTVLRLVAGLEDATEGVIKIDGTVVNDVPSRNRDVAMVFQSYALYPHMSVFDNIGFTLRMQGLEQSSIARRVGAVAQVLRLGSLLARKPAELSGGEQQRVALARAMVRNPQVFLFDEPLSSLDAKLRMQTRVELKRVHRAVRATFLYVTHDQVEAMTMADRIAVMNEGSLQQVAPPRDIYDRPANIFVAGFVGSPAMNLLPVSVEGRRARASGFEVSLPQAFRVDRGILGFRPEALTARIDDRWPQLRIEVALAEVVGPYQFVHGSVGGDDIIARLDPGLKVRKRDRLQLSLRPQALHLFDAESGRTIL